MDLRRTVGTVAASVRPKWTARARMRPGYLIIGTKRGGSTSLAAWVSQHPQTAPCLSNKGTHFFDINYPRGPQWYFSRFEKPRDGWRTTGEASPYYMYHPAAPERIATTLPEVKLIAVLRDPVERAWSQYRYEVSRGNETETFERALDLEPERLRGERERLLNDPTYPGKPYRHHGYLERGHYAEQLERFFARFSREQVLLLGSEQMFADPHSELGRVWDFLGLEQMRLPELAAYHDLLEKKRSEPSRDSDYNPERLPSASRERLLDYYRPLNRQLYELTELDFGWPDSRPTTKTPSPGDLPA
ncbi:MAG TPA: sulfotransferase domain-containing protein [Nocardioidaceae bacterium]|nr:sulfotransferase domain-containing protein [Nocardioidaceae bacterium]